MERPFSWILEVNEIENVPKSQKTNESDARAQILHNKVACCQRPKKQLLSTQQELWPILFSHKCTLLAFIFVYCRTHKRNCVWEKVKIIEKTEHVGITCADEITSSSQSHTRGIFCSVSFQEVCLCDKQKLRSFFWSYVEHSPGKTQWSIVEILR